MISKYLQEQRRYSQEDLCNILECTEEKAVSIIKRLKSFGILKTVGISDVQKEMSELADEDVIISDVNEGDNTCYYVFTYVGIITIAERVLKCYPKYIVKNTEPRKELQQIIKVLQKYNSKEQIVYLFNDNGEKHTFNLLAVMLSLLNDYYENGIYTNTEDIIESNGSGEILWDKTINETFTILYNNRPYYADLLTKKRVNDDYDFFKRLHECVLSRFTKELEAADLLDIFGILPVELSDEKLSDFGDKEYLLYRIENELSVQFNTRKQMILKTIYAYLANQGTLDDINGFSLFGTNSFNLVWEKVCAEVLDNQLNTRLGDLQLSVPLDKSYKGTDTLISLIEKPKWNGVAENGEFFVKEANDTLIPDLISIYKDQTQCDFIIFDAKYYRMTLEVNRKISGQPGISDVTKQYLYQLAYRKFIEAHKIANVKNCFLMPTEEDIIVNKGYANMDMLDALGLQHIQIRLLPAKMMYEHYLKGTKLDIALLCL